MRRVKDHYVGGWWDCMSVEYELPISSQVSVGKHRQLPSPSYHHTIRKNFTLFKTEKGVLKKQIMGHYCSYQDRG